MTANTCVWFEIPASDLERARGFYAAVLGRDLSVVDGGPNPIVPLTNMADAGVSGHLYPGTPPAPGAGPTIHIAAPADLDTTADRVRQAGGTVHGDPVEIPSGRFIYATDPDGNSLGFFAA